MKRKILFGVGLFLFLLFAAGVGAIYLLNQITQEQSRASQSIFERTQALQSLRYETSSINTYYLPDMLMGTSELVPIKEPALYLKSRQRMEEDLAVARKECPNIPVSQLEDLESAMKSYFLRYDQLFEELPTSRDKRILEVNDIADASQKISDLSQGLVNGLEDDFRASSASVKRRAMQDRFIIGSLLLSGLLILFFLSALTDRIIVKPILEITESIREVQNGNFELILPLRKSKDELSLLIPAFNEMVAELKTRQKDSEDQLLKIDLLSRAILTNFPNPIILLNAKGQIVRLNPQAETLFAESAHLGTLPTRIQTQVDEAITENKEYLPQDLDKAVLIRREEKEFYYLPRIFPLSNPDESNGGWVLLLTEVSRLRFADDLKTNLISTISHEIKTPLTGIRMVLHLLLEAKTGALNETQEEMLNSAHADCERLLETLRNLLEMSRTDSGNNSLSLSEIESSQIIEEALNTFETIASEKNIKFVRDYEEQPTEVVADKMRILEVVNNLLSNALKHSPQHGKVTLKIATRGTDFVRFSVSDEGPGVPEEARGRIFDRFYRAEGQDGVEGIGLGLSIAREIISAHEGQIGLDTGPSGETEFYFELPRA